MSDEFGLRCKLTTRRKDIRSDNQNDYLDTINLSNMSPSYITSVIRIGFSTRTLPTLYKLPNITAAPPSSAPIPITPVGIAIAAARAVLEALIAPVGAEPKVVLAVIPEVNGAAEPELAPANATEVEVGFGAADVLLGLRTLI